MSAVEPEMQPQRPADAAGKGGGKARLLTLEDLDRRTKAYQDTAELQERIVTDLGGADRLSAMQGELVTVAALLGAILRDAGARYLKGQPIDLAEFVTVANAQRRHLNDLGLQKAMKDVTPSLSEYLAGRSPAA